MRGLLESTRRFVSQHAYARRQLTSHGGRWGEDEGKSGGRLVDGGEGMACKEASKVRDDTLREPAFRSFLCMI